MLDKKSHRIALAKFMASSHRLGVETGRLARPIIPYEQRLCENCQKLDDEYHFLLECTKLSELKKMHPTILLFETLHVQMCAVVKFKWHKTIRMLGRYVYKAFCQIVQPSCWLYIVLLLFLLSWFCLQIYACRGQWPKSDWIKTLNFALHFRHYADNSYVHEKWNFDWNKNIAGKFVSTNDPVIWFFPILIGGHHQTEVSCWR